VEGAGTQIRDGPKQIEIEGLEEREALADDVVGQSLLSSSLFEEVGVLGDVALHVVWDLVLGVDSLHRALRLARAAIYALLGVYEELVSSVVDTVYGTDLHAGLVLGADTGLRYDVGQ
jgi:hypothetical protein